MRRLFLAVTLIGLVGGCSSSASLSGGKPVEHWVQAAKDPDAHVRRTAIAKLGNAGAAEAGAWAVVKDALHDRDAGVRREAILAVMKCGPRASEVLPSLTELEQRDPDPRVREGAAKAVRKLKAESAAAP